MRRLMTWAAGAMLAASGATAASAGDVAVTLTDVRADAGPIQVGLATEAQFRGGDTAVSRTVEPTADGTLVVTLPDAPPGRYAVSVWQDTDGDGRFSMGADGRPSDGWSMLNAADLRGPPTFEATSAEIGEAPAAFTLAMVYPR